MSGVGLFLMLSSFLYYLVRFRSRYSGRSRMPGTRLVITVIVVLSWLGGLSLILLFAPINDDAVATAALYHPYVLSFFCLFVLIFFVTIRGMYESVSKHARESRQIARSIQSAIFHFDPTTDRTPVRAKTKGASSRGSSNKRRVVALAPPQPRPAHSDSLTNAELLVLARDAEVRRR
jgi:hypothetical protein